MNERRDHILEEYRNADLNRRLHMYLQSPELRSDFFLLEQEDLKAGSVAVAKRSGNIRERIRNFFGRKVSCFLKEAFDWRI